MNMNQAKTAENQVGGGGREGERDPKAEKHFRFGIFEIIFHAIFTNQIESRF